MVGEGVDDGVDQDHSWDESGGAEQQCKTPEKRGVPSVPSNAVPNIRLNGIEVTEKYKLAQKVGKGALGIVRLGIDKETGEKVAVKVIDLRHSTHEMLEREVNTLRELTEEHGGHPNIIGLKGVYQNSKALYIVTDFVGGGELFDHLSNSGAYSEKLACSLLLQVVKAIQFLHEHDYCHGDLKPENLVLSNADIHKANLMVIDFGCSSRGTLTKGKKKAPQDLFTPAYSPPEVLMKGISSPAQDMWALGVLMFTMLGGTHPFVDYRDGGDPKKMVQVL
jgi:serine/threonine protein kinase